MKNANRLLLSLLAALVVGQVISYVVAPDSWKNFVAVLPKIIGMIAFWSPIIALIVFGLVSLTMRLLGFVSFEDLRRESVEENNPAPAIVFAGTLIASILFLMIVIKP